MIWKMLYCVVNQGRALILAPVLKCTVQLSCDWSLGSAKSVSFPTLLGWIHATGNIFARMRGAVLLGNTDAAMSYTVKRRMHHRKKARKTSKKQKSFNAYALAESRKSVR